MTQILTQPGKPGPAVPRAVLFDLDGTLVDTLDDLADSVNTVLSARGLPVHPVAAYRYFVGDGVRMLLTRALPGRVKDPETVQDAVAAFSEEYRRRWKHKSRPYPGITAMLETLKAHGLPLGVLTNKPQEFATRVVEHFFGSALFTTVVGHRDEVPVKPDPAPALAAATQLGVAARDTALVGDSGVDIKTAVAAHMEPYGVLWGFRTKTELVAAGARVVFEYPWEVARHITRPGEAEQTR